MDGFKRFCLIAFSLVGIALLVVLALPWIGPWTELFAGFLAMGWYLFCVELALLAVAIGFVAVFIRGCTMRRHRDVEVLSGDGTSVTIARSAIASQATYLAEQDGSVVVTKVVVKVRHGTTVDVKVSVQPYQSVNVRAEAQALQERLRTGLELLVGDGLDRLTLRFLEPRATGDSGPGPTVEPDEGDGYVPSPIHQVNREARRVAGEEPVAAPDYGVEASTRVVVEPTPRNDMTSLITARSTEFIENGRV